MAIALIGQTVLILSVFVTIGGALFCFIAAKQSMQQKNTGVLARFGLMAPQLLLGLVSSAVFVLLLALTARDYTLSYVQGRISNDLSFGLRLTALWSGQQGSLLLWLLLLSGYAVLMVRSLKKASMPEPLVLYSSGIILSIASFFALLVAAIARPFEVASQLTLDGAGMSPSLQNYWMAAHPPALYLGYVGVSVPFAIMAGALLSKRQDDTWVLNLRVWTIASWTFLGAGLVLGARWAYEEIGWGGYWAWDPVENAALMPWLTLTALMHSIMVQKRRGMMRFWNVILISLTFALSIFGTFITRSGVLSSVHSFVASPVGWWFLGFLAIVILFSMSLLYARSYLLQAKHDIESIVSRETAFLFNNLLLIALALVVLWGVIFPIMSSAFTSSRISIDQPWYNFFATAFGLPLLFLLAFAPYVAWRGTSIKVVAKKIRIPLLVTVASAIALAVFGAGSSPTGLAAVCLGILVIVGVFIDLIKIRSRRRIGAWIAHAGLALLVIGIAGGAWSTRVEHEFKPGDSIKVGSYVVTFKNTTRERTKSTMRTRAIFEIKNGDRSLGEMKAGRDFHPVSGEASNEVAIRHDWLRAQDLFITVDRLTENNTAQVVVLINQLMPMVWLGGLLIIIGGVVVAVPLKASTRKPSVSKNATSDTDAVRTRVYG